MIYDGQSGRGTKTYKLVAAVIYQSDSLKVTNVHFSIFKRRVAIVALSSLKYHLEFSAYVIQTPRHKGFPLFGEEPELL